MDNITQFVFMLHGFAKFNEVQPNIKQWNKIHDEYLKTTTIDSCQDLIDVAVAPTTYQELIVAINSVEQVPTSAQWREIKAIAEETIDQIRMEVDLDELYAARMDDDFGDYEIEDDFLPEAHYSYEPRMVVSATELKVGPIVYSTDVEIPFTVSTLNDVGLSHVEISIIDDFIANSYRQKTFEF